MCVCDTAEYFYGFIDRELEQSGIKPTRDGQPLSSRDLVSIVDGYKGLGYGENTEEELSEDSLTFQHGYWMRAILVFVLTVVMDTNQQYCNHVHTDNVSVGYTE